MQEPRLMDEVGSAVLVIAQAKVKLLCTKFLQANHDAAAAQESDSSLLDRLAPAPWGFPDNDPIPPGSSSKARTSQRSRGVDGDNAGHADSPTQGRCHPPPFLAPPTPLQPDSVDDALRQLCRSPHDPMSHSHPPAGSDVTAGMQSMPVFEAQLAQLQMHLRDHEVLQGLLGSSTSAAVHPHAIDGAELAVTAASAALSSTSLTGDRQAAGQQAALPHPAAVGGINSAAWSAPHVPGFGPSGGPGFGSSQWGADVGSSGGRSHTQQGSRAEGPVPMHPGVILSGFAVMVERVVDGVGQLSCASQEQLDRRPGAAALVASPHISTSHAAHLAVRVRMHTASVGRLLELRTQLKTRLGSAEQALGVLSTTVHAKMERINSQCAVEEAAGVPAAATPHLPSTPPAPVSVAPTAQLATPLFMGMGGRSAFGNTQSSSPPPQPQSWPSSSSFPSHSPPYPVQARQYASSNASSSTPIPPPSIYSSGRQHITGAGAASDEPGLSGSGEHVLPGSGSSQEANQHQQPLPHRQSSALLGGISPWVPNGPPIEHHTTADSNQMPSPAPGQPHAVHRHPASPPTRPALPPQQTSRGGHHAAAAGYPDVATFDEMDVDSEPDLDLIAREALAMNWQEIGTMPASHAQPSAAQRPPPSELPEGEQASNATTSSVLHSPSSHSPPLPATCQHRLHPQQGSPVSCAAASVVTTGPGPRRLDFGGPSESSPAGADTPQGSGTAHSSIDVAVPSSTAHHGSRQHEPATPPATGLSTAAAHVAAAVTMSTLLQRYNRVSKY
ncbi:MAG: hypothetical protein WDW36_001256 [Sanguina aurantia]